MLKQLSIAGGKAMNDMEIKNNDPKIFYRDRISVRKYFIHTLVHEFWDKISIISNTFRLLNFSSPSSIKILFG